MSKLPLRIAGAICVLALAGCGRGGDASPTPSSAAATSKSSTLRPDAAQTTALLAALGKIDPGLADERSVGRSVNTCSDLKAGKADDVVATNAVARFTGGSVPTLTAEQGAAIVAAVRASFCA